nr:hypothetical protein [uncultured Carboxylicivirga sp.]
MLFFAFKEVESYISNNKLLLPFYIDNIKVGYFIANIIGNKVIIRTFILTTHNSAPEGQKFQKLTGFTKYDMSYWNISSLQTFINNRMPENHQLYSLFEESNLLTLFNLNKDLVDDHRHTSTSINWQKLINCFDDYNKRQSQSYFTINV